MLNINTSLLNLSKRNVYDFHLKQMNPSDIGKLCITIAISEVLFEQYRKAINRDKYYIKVQNDDAIKGKQVFSDIIPRTLILLYVLYLHEKFILIVTVKEDQSRKVECSGN